MAVARDPRDPIHPGPKAPTLPTMNPIRPRPLAAGVLFAAMLSQAAFAQTPPAKVVTRDELRTCMNSEATLASQRKELEARSKVNGEEAAAIRAEAEQLKAEQEKIIADNARGHSTCLH